MTRPGETRILLLRHAETSAPDLFHGSESDVGLGERGREQAVRAGERIARERPDAVVSSEMRRARETAGLIALAAGVVPTTWPGLHERQMGAMSGQPRAESWHVYEETKDRWIAGEVDFTHPGGESFAAIADRASRAFLALLADRSGTSTVVVAHGVLNRILIASLAEGYGPADFDRIPIDFVGTHDLRWDGTTLRLIESWPGDPTPPLRPNPPRP